MITAHLFTYSTVHFVGGRRIITQPTIASALRPPALACDLPHTNLLGTDRESRRRPRGGCSSSRPPGGNKSGSELDLSWVIHFPCLPRRRRTSECEEVVRSEASKGPSCCARFSRLPRSPGAGVAPRNGVGDGDAGSGFRLPSRAQRLAPCALSAPWCVPSHFLSLSGSLSLSSFRLCRSPVTSRALLGINITHHQP